MPVLLESGDYLLLEDGSLLLLEDEGVASPIVNEWGQRVLGDVDEWSKWTGSSPDPRR